jgi:exodeoxyribonuclease-3
MKTIYSFNVNGIRAAFRKGLSDWIQTAQPDVLGLQETKAWASQLDSSFQLEGYHLFLSQCHRKGYSGVGLYCKEKPQEIVFDWLDDIQFDQEGRIVFARFSDFVLLNVYFPNGVSGSERLQYKMNFYQVFAQKVKQLVDSGEKVIVMGDVNTAHHAIDLSRPKENEKNSGFLPQERAWIDAFLSIGMVDTYRHFYPDTAQMYSWWDMKTAGRERNVGWRIDYIFVSENLIPRCHDASICQDVYGSDHCPVKLALSHDNA